MVGGTLSDIWRTNERAGPMALFSWAAVSFIIFKPNKIFIKFNYLL